VTNNISESSNHTHKTRVENIKSLCCSRQNIHVLAIRPGDEDLSWLGDYTPVFIESIVGSRELYHYDASKKIFIVYYELVKERPVLYFDSGLKEQLPATIFFMTTTLSYMIDSIIHVWTDNINHKNSVLVRDRYVTKIIR